MIESRPGHARSRAKPSFVHQPRSATDRIARCTQCQSDHRLGSSYPRSSEVQQDEDSALKYHPSGNHFSRERQDSKDEREAHGLDPWREGGGDQTLDMSGSYRLADGGSFNEGHACIRHAARILM